MESIKDKIKKLMALANNAGATEHEAAQAMEMASALMIKYNIELPAEESNEVVQGPTVFMGFEEHWHTIAGQAAAYLFMCKVVTNMPRGRGFYFIGRPTNIEMAVDTFDSLLKQIERLYKEHLPKGLSVTERANFRRTFKFSCANRVYARSVQIVENFKKTGLPEIEHSKSTALVVVDSIQQQIEEVRIFMQTKCEGLVVSPIKSRAAGLGTSAGRLAGDRVKFAKEVKQ